MMTFNGTTWNNLGSPRFSAGSAYYFCMALHPTTGVPFVAYQDVVNSRKPP